MGNIIVVGVDEEGIHHDGEDQTRGLCVCVCVSRESGMCGNKYDTMQGVEKQ